jgi:hypothetical protein
MKACFEEWSTAIFAALLPLLLGKAGNQHQLPFALV